MEKSGLFLIYKEENMTSREVDNYLKKKFNVNKIGHFGTLDPFAEGLLIVGINKGTTLFNYLNENNKEYIGKIKLGIATSTLDKEGEIIDRKDVPNLSREEVINVLKSFLGEQEQLIPKYSATKINGKEFYKLAREDEDKVPEVYKKINVYSIDLISFEDNEILFSCSVSKGTYIRQLAYDISKKLNTVGYLENLMRTKVANYSLKDAKKLSEIKEEDLLTFKEVAFKMFPVVMVTDNQYNWVIHGGRFNSKTNQNHFILLVDCYQKIIGIYENVHNNVYRCKEGLYNFDLN